MSARIGRSRRRRPAQSAAIRRAPRPSPLRTRLRRHPRLPATTTGGYRGPAAAAAADIRGGEWGRGGGGRGGRGKVGRGSAKMEPEPAAAAPRGLPARAGPPGGLGGRLTPISRCCSRRCLLCEPPPFSLRGRGLAGPIPGGAGGAARARGPLSGLRPPPRCAPRWVQPGRGAPRRKGRLFFFFVVWSVTQRYFCRAVCVCVSAKQGGVASRRLGRFVIVRELQKGR